MPIDKNDRDIYDENNYRPISVVGHIAKKDKGIVSYQINDLLKEHSFILMEHKLVSTML